MGFETYPQKHQVPIDPEVPENTRTEPTGEFGWRYRDGDNHAITAVGGEGFTSEQHAERAALQVAKVIHAEVEASYENKIRVKHVED